MGRPQGGVFLGATPETLVRVQAGRVATEALAGTLARGQGDAAVLEGSTKDLAEHRWTADMVERTLRRHCSEVTRNGPRAVQFRDLFHLRTELSATLRDPQALLTLVDELHPTPAVGGSPRDRALQLIDRLETFDRGWYAAPVGWLASDGDGHFAVALRSALCAEHGAHAFAGAGIVLGSEPEAEWRETATKLLPATTCLQWIQEA
jgi:menaquinone-specific isochorismate synthase